MRRCSSRRPARGRGRVPRSIPACWASSPTSRPAACSRWAASGCCWCIPRRGSRAATYVYPHSGPLARFAEADADVVLYGHTHVQMVRRVGQVLVVNPGSAGDARDPTNGRRLSCAVLDTATEAVQVIDYPDARYAQPG